MTDTLDPGTYGWCHHCETFQLRAKAPMLRVPYMGAQLVPCCAVCGADEPWEFGVWDAEQFAVGDNACMTAAGVRRHCERQDSMYPGDCEGCRL